MKTNSIFCYFLSSIAYVTFAGCYDPKQEVGEPSIVGLRAIYLQARHDNKMFSDEFGDLYMFDYKSGETYKLTDDDYYDASPLWFPDGRSVLFLSNRVGSWSTLKVKGIGGPHEMYRLWLKSKKIERIDERLGKSFPDIFDGYYKSMQWHPDGRTLLLCGFDNRIYRMLPEKDSTWLFLDLNPFLKARDEKLYNFSLRPDSGCLVLVVDLNQGSLAVRTYQFSDSLLHPIPHIGSLPVFGGWSPDGKKLLISSGSMLYELDTRKDSFITLIESDSIYVSPNSAFFVDEKTITFLGGRKKIEGEVIDRETEIVYYNIMEKRLTYLTKDGKFKDCLSVSKSE